MNPQPHAHAPAAAPSSPRPLETWVGASLAGVLVLSLLMAARDAYHHREELGPLAVGDPAPAFMLPTLGTLQPLSLEQLRGQVVVLDFWATWCPPCVREMPELAALYREFNGRGLTVVGINREPDQPDKVAEFVNEHDITFPVVLDVDGVGERYRMVSLPTTVVIDRAGRVARQFMGYASPQAVREVVLPLLGPG